MTGDVQWNAMRALNFGVWQEATLLSGSGEIPGDELWRGSESFEFWSLKFGKKLHCYPDPERWRVTNRGGSESFELWSLAGCTAIRRDAGWRARDAPRSHSPYIRKHQSTPTLSFRPNQTKAL